MNEKQQKILEELQETARIINNDTDFNRELDESLRKANELLFESKETKGRK